MGHHVVRSGETLSSIAHRYHTSARILARMNGIHDPNRLALGRRLEVPGPRDAQPEAARSSAAQPQPSRTGARAQSNTAAPQTPRPVAQAGDVTAEQLSAIMPDAGNRVDTFLAALNAAMRAHGVDTMERRAAFLAQISVESGDLRNTEEQLNYTAQNLADVRPRSFSTTGRRHGAPNEQASELARRGQQAVANHIYANVNGNGDEASGDGWRYHGRGLMQTTGRTNYRAAGYENNPETLAEPATAADSAGQFWSDNGLNDQTNTELDRRAFDAVSGTVNGMNPAHGADRRWQAYQRALTALRPAPAQ